MQPLLDAGDFEAATAQLNRALEDDPADADARIALGVTTFLAGVETLAHTAWAHGLIDVSADFGVLLGTGRGLLPMGWTEDPLQTHVEDVEAALEAFAASRRNQRDPRADR